MSTDERNSVPRGVWIALITLAGATLVAELFIHHHGYFGVDASFAFYGWYTLVCGVAGVLAARLVGAVLRRREDYRD